MDKLKLASYLLTIYYSGAGDAGSEDMVPSLRNSLINPLNKNILEAGYGCKHSDGLTTTEHFELIAERIIELLKE